MEENLLGALEVLKEVETVWMGRKPGKTLRNVSRARLLLRRAVADGTIPPANRTKHMLSLLYQYRVVLSRAFYLIRVPAGVKADERLAMQERRYRYQAYLKRFAAALREYAAAAAAPPPEVNLPEMADAVFAAVEALDPEGNAEGEVEGYFDDLPDLR